MELIMIVAMIIEKHTKARKQLVSLPFEEVRGKFYDEEITQKARKPMVSLTFLCSGMVNSTPK